MFRAHGNPEIQSLLRRMDPEALIGTASYTDPGDRRPLLVPEDVQRRPRRRAAGTSRKTAAFTTSSGYARLVPDADHEPRLRRATTPTCRCSCCTRTRCRRPRACGTRWACTRNQSGPVEIDAVIPDDRMVGWPGDGAPRTTRPSTRSPSCSTPAPTTAWRWPAWTSPAATRCARRTRSTAAASPTTRRSRTPTAARSARRRRSRLFAYSMARALDDAHRRRQLGDVRRATRRGAPHRVHVVGPRGQGARRRAREPRLGRDAADLRRPRLHARRTRSSASCATPRPAG